MVYYYYDGTGWTMADVPDGDTAEDYIICQKCFKNIEEAGSEETKELLEKIQRGR